MTTELRVRSTAAQQLYVRALSMAYRNNVQLHDPSLWLLREPEVEEKMLRDADIAHAVGYRRHLIAGRQWELVPENQGSPRADMAVAVGGELLKRIQHFTQARLNLARAFFSGARFARIHGTHCIMPIGDGRPRCWWVPQRIEDADKRFYRIVPHRDERARKTDAHWERWSIDKDDWVPIDSLEWLHTIKHVYQDDQATLGHGRALREALGWWWYAKEHVFQESLQAVERFAQGILTAKVDGVRDAETGLPNRELIDAWREVLEDLRSRHVLVYDSSDQIEHVTMDSGGWQLLGEIRNELRSTIFTLVLGANLTTSAEKGGSYALAEVQENSTEELVQFDRETLEETLTDDLLGCVWYRNHANLVELGIAGEKPRLAIKQEKKLDPKERADVAAVLNGMGVQLSLDDVLEQTGFRKPDPGEEVVAPQMATPGFGDPFGGGGMFGGFGGNGNGNGGQQPAPQQPASNGPATQGSPVRR
jgi:hypothetical protein